MSTPTPKWQVDFLRYARPLGLGAAVAVLLSLAALFVPGPNYGIDFLGGSNITVRFNRSVSDDELRTAAQALGMNDAEVQSFEGSGTFEYQLRTKSISSITPEQLQLVTAAAQGAFGASTAVQQDAEATDRVFIRLPRSAYGFEDDSDDPVEFADVNELNTRTEALRAQLQAALEAGGLPGISVAPYGNATDRRFAMRSAGLQALLEQQMQASFGDSFIAVDRVETVGPRVGEQLRTNTIKAIMISLLLIMLYMAFRFDIRYAPAAVIGLFHDVMIIIGIFILFRIEINLPIVAALLTVVGYSLNDTIIIYDRIRENIQEAGANPDLRELVNRSLNECLTRTIVTGLSTLTAVGAILLFGGSTIFAFALAMTLGVIIGTFSTIFVVAPLMIYTSRELDRRKREVTLSHRQPV